MTSPRTMARLAGSLYLFSSMCFVFAILLRPGIEAGGTADLAERIRASALLFRVSLFCDVVAASCFLLTGMALYALLRHVHGLAAAAMAVFVSILVTVMLVGEADVYTALTVVAGPGYTHAFGADASNALVTLYLHARGNAFVIDEVFWGLWLVPLSYLVLRSRQIPRLVGVLLAIAAVAWVAQFAADLLAPDLPYGSGIGEIGGLGELVFAGWLVAFGIRPPAPAQPVAAAAASVDCG